MTAATSEKSPRARRTVPTAERTEWTRACIAFVRAIGLPVREEAVAAESFIPHVHILDGGLVVDVEGAFPGDVLHEAGHLAVIPQVFRPLATRTLDAVEKAMGRHLEAHGEGLFTYPEDPLCRACLQADEQSATAWQYAAALEVSLPMKWLFPDDAFEGKAKSVLRGLQLSNHMGINGLQAASWTLRRANPHRNLPVYPKLAFWLSP